MVAGQAPATSNLPVMSGSILGAAVKRVEDPRFIRGEGTYVSNMKMDGMLHMAVVRSEVPHANLAEIDIAEATAMPGVAGVYTADNLDLPLIPHGRRGLPDYLGRPPLAKGVVRFVGDVIAVVVAETAQQAADAADTIWVDYDIRPSVGTLETALAKEAPLVWPEFGTNEVIDYADEDKADLFDGADHTFTYSMYNQRLAAVPLEPNNALAMPDGDGLKIWAGSQHIQGTKSNLAKALNLHPDAIHAIVPDMGGGFGAKFPTYPEQIICAALALRLQRPIHWQERRSANIAAMYHGRAQQQDIQVGVTTEGRIVGLRVDYLQEAGAYPTLGAYLPFLTMKMSSGCYAIDRIEARAKAIVTNTAPTHAYRGAGRPEATAMIERVMDLLAADLDLDPAEIRRRNFITPDQFPYKSRATARGYVYDTGDYEMALDTVLANSNYPSLRANQAERRASGARKQIGIGLSTYVEVTAPFGGIENSDIQVHADGTVTAAVGTSSHGQGHATAYTQILGELMGIPHEDITIIQGDTALVPKGGGTGGSRSLQLGGSAVLGAGEAVIEKAKQIVGHQLEASPDDIVVIGDGTLGVAGVPGATMAWGTIAQKATEEEPAGLTAAFEFDQGHATFPFGAHVCVTEVDTETGEVEILQMITVDDAGKVLNPILIQGQVHGGVAQGIGQALIEEVLYDAEGYLLSGNLTTYLIPSSMDVPSIWVTNTETVTPHNPLGAKGIGEAGTIGATPAVHNSILDAIRHLGVNHIDMPLTPHRIWTSLNR